MTIDLNAFTLAEALAAADELEVTLSPEQARLVAQHIVTTKFPVCVRQHIKENYD